LVLCAVSATAQENTTLYQATAIVTGTDMRQRPSGFAECLTEVLVKVAGAPKLADDPRVAQLTEHADALVRSFDYVDPRAWFLHHDDQGTYDRSYELSVRFDPAKVNAALATLAQAPWQGQRPLLEPVILIRRDENPYLLSATDPRGSEMRRAIISDAAAVGLGVHFPTDAELAAWGVTLVGFPAPLSNTRPDRFRVLGSLNWNVRALGWVGTWRADAAGSEHRWQISGVGYDQAFASMVKGAVMLAHGTGTP
jgi:uncharacterized protein